MKDFANEAWKPPVHVLMIVDEKPTKVLRIEPITFGVEDARLVHYSHNDDLVVTTVIDNHNVHRVLVDSVSSVDVLYFNALVRLGLAWRSNAQADDAAPLRLYRGLSHFRGRAYDDNRGKATSVDGDG